MTMKAKERVTLIEEWRQAESIRMKKAKRIIDQREREKAYKKRKRDGDYNFWV